MGVRHPQLTTVAREYVLARSVLLDALDALGGQRAAVVLVGAQAVYLHAGEADLATAPMTTDADLTIDVRRVIAEPDLAAAMHQGGFEPGDQPGSWIGRFDVAVDLMVAPHQSGRTTPSARAGRIPGHATNAVRIARGLEAALVDRDDREITALDPTDERGYIVSIAGPAALLVAKLIKLRERVADERAARRSRVEAKDALDVLRLLRGVEVDVFAAGFARHRGDPYATAVTENALEFLRQSGMDDGGRLAQLINAASGGDRTLPASLAALTEQLLSRCG